MQLSREIESCRSWIADNSSLGQVILPAMMASGSGKNEDKTEPNELVDSLSLKSNMASSIPELSPAAPPFKGLGPLEAGDRDSSATTAAAAEWKGEEPMAFSRRGSAGGKPPLPPCPASTPRARGEYIDMNDLLNEQVKSPTIRHENANKRPLRTKVKPLAAGPKKGKKPLWIKCHFSAPRNVLIAILLLVSILMLPAQTEGFQHFHSIEDAAKSLAEVNHLGDIWLQLEQEAHVPGAGFEFDICLHPILIAICTFLLLALFLWFIDPEEH